VSYITLGVAIAGPIATIGGLVHLVHQGFMKITLFFCAGNLAETLGVTRSASWPASAGACRGPWRRSRWRPSA
jgi:multicomponent Na+:H+ antiporter subunit D